MRVSPDPRDFQTGALVQACVLGHSPMSCAQARHQLPVQRRLTPVRALIRQDEVVDQDLGVSAPHGRDEGGEDSVVDRVRPILDDGVKEVCSCA